MQRNSGFRFQVSGFTLIELLVVVTIIGILVGIVLGMAGFASKKSDRARAIANLEKIKDALEEYRITYGAYPTNSPATNNSVNWVYQLWVQPNLEGKQPFLSGTFLTSTNVAAPFLDPWGNDYRYLHSSTAPYATINNSQFGFDLWSMGPDALSDADDIANWRGDF